MPSEKEIEIIKKAVAYDLKLILNENPDKTYTQKELEQIIDSYVAKT